MRIAARAEDAFGYCWRRKWSLKQIAFECGRKKDNRKHREDVRKAGSEHSSQLWPLNSKVPFLSKPSFYCIRRTSFFLGHHLATVIHLLIPIVFAIFQVIVSGSLLVLAILIDQVIEIALCLSKLHLVHSLVSKPV